MNLGPVLDVSIGMVFIYFLLALIASGIQEFVAGVFTWRGTYLRRAVDVILSNESRVSFGWSFLEFFQAHLSWTAPALKPSASALAAMTVAQIAAMTKVQNVPNHPLLSGVPNKLPSYIPSRNFSLALLDTLRDGSGAPLVTQIQNTIATLPQGDLQRTLTTFVQDAGGDLDAFRKHVEQWFDDAMDRVNGIYSRLSQYFLLLAGLGIAVALNVNSFTVSEALWRSPSLTGSIVAQATQTATDLSKLPCPPATDSSAKIDQARAQTNAKTDQASCSDAAKMVTANVTAVKSLPLPIGWPQPPLKGAWDWFAALGGWIVTAGAVGLGAPFWFGLLQNLTNFRNAGPAPKSKDA